MLAKRIIPCLDIKDGRVVKGVNFLGLKDAGDPVELAKQYSKSGADELIFLDISATEDKRKTLADLVLKIAAVINIPFTVGGGISSVEDAELLLRSGADKIAVNSSAIRDPMLISELASRFGSQCITLAVDAKLSGNNWQVYLVGGKQETKLELFSWAQKVESLGAGEILFTSINHDGTRKGFANEALARLSSELSIPIIASGGAGNMDHIFDAFHIGKADAVLAASIFHYGEISIPLLKEYLQNKRIPIRF